MIIHLRRLQGVFPEEPAEKENLSPEECTDEGLLVPLAY